MFLSLSAQMLNEQSFRLRLSYLADGEVHQLIVEPGTTTAAKDGLQLSYTLLERNGNYMLHAAVLANKAVKLVSFELVSDYDYTQVDKIFTNGYQCWTTSYEYDTNERIRGLANAAKGIAQHYGDYNLYDYSGKKGVIHGWTYAYTRQDSQLHFLGSVDESGGYTLLKYKVQDSQLVLSKDCKGKIILPNREYNLLKVFEALGSDSTVFAGYEVAFDRQLQANLASQPNVTLNDVPPPALGWTSWYHYFHDINEDIILENLQAFSSRDIPLQMFQIDDGYQESVGVWTRTNARFPNGMKPIADSIHAAGYKAGIWIAPFIVEKDSKVYQEHPDWVLHDDKSKPIKAGLNPGWSGAYYGLDVYNKDVQAYLKNTLDTIFRVWGYDMIKTDFLFAATLHPPAGKTRGEVMTDAMLLLREWTGDKLILGCGVPLGPSFRVVDYCRVSSDIHMKWEVRLLKAIHARERLSCWNSQTTVIGRRQLSGRFFRNDPDVYVLRDEKNKLKPAQKHTMFFVNNLFGQLVFTSDNINNYTPEQMQLYLSGFPYLDKQIHDVQRNGDHYTVRFGIGKREYQSYINLGKKKFKAILPKGEYFNSQTGEFVSGELTIGPFETLCLSVVQPGIFEVLGSTSYLFPGADVHDLRLVDDKHLNITFVPGSQQQGVVYISIPQELELNTVNGQTCEVREIGDRKVLIYKP